MRTCEKSTDEGKWAVLDCVLLSSSLPNGGSAIENREHSIAGRFFQLEPVAPKRAACFFGHFIQRDIKRRLVQRSRNPNRTAQGRSPELAEPRIGRPMPRVCGRIGAKLPMECACDFPHSHAPREIQADCIIFPGIMLNRARAQPSTVPAIGRGARGGRRRTYRKLAEIRAQDIKKACS